MLNDVELKIILIEFDSLVCIFKTLIHLISTQGVCESALFLLCGFDEPQLNKTLLETIMHHTPAGTSTKTVIHYIQEIKSKKFLHYDYGKDGNLEHYGQEVPPEFDIKAVKTPIASYW